MVRRRTAAREIVSGKGTENCVASRCFSQLNLIVAGRVGFIVVLGDPNDRYTLGG